MFEDPAIRPQLQRPDYRNAAGERVPSVTTVIGATFAKPALTAWANRLGMQGMDSERYRDERAGEGSVMHALIHAHLRREEADLSPFSPTARAGGRVGFLRWRRDWLDHQVLSPIASEHSLVSERHQYGGTPDLIAGVSGRVELLDWKTSKRVYVEHLVQAAAYAAMAWEHGHQVRAVRVVAVSTEADGAMHEVVMPVEDTRPYFAAFLAALRLYRRAKALAEVVPA